jgi:hypothetical protein
VTKKTFTKTLIEYSPYKLKLRVFTDTDNPIWWFVLLKHGKRVATINSLDRADVSTGCAGMSRHHISQPGFHKDKFETVWQLGDKLWVCRGSNKGGVQATEIENWVRYHIFVKVVLPCLSDEQKKLIEIVYTALLDTNDTINSAAPMPLTPMLDPPRPSIGQTVFDRLKIISNVRCLTEVEVPGVGRVIPIYDRSVETTADFVFNYGKAEQKYTTDA